MSFFFLWPLLFSLFSQNMTGTPNVQSGAERLQRSLSAPAILEKKETMPTSSITRLNIDFPVFFSGTTGLNKDSSNIKKNDSAPDYARSFSEPYLKPHFQEEIWRYAHFFSVMPVPGSQHVFKPFVSRKNMEERSSTLTPQTQKTKVITLTLPSGEKQLLSSTTDIKMALKQHLIQDNVPSSVLDNIAYHINEITDFIYHFFLTNSADTELLILRMFNNHFLRFS